MTIPDEPSDPNDASEPQPGEAAGAEAFGHAVKVIRTGMNLGRRELAERAGLSYSYLAEIENGTKQASTSAQAAIARALDLPVSSLWAATEEWGQHFRDTTSRDPAGSAPLETIQRTVLREPLAQSPAALGARARQLRWFRDTAARRMRETRAAEELFEDEPVAALRKRSRPRERDEHLDAVIERMRRVLAGMSDEDRERVLDLAERLVEK